MARKRSILDAEHRRRSSVKRGGAGDFASHLDEGLANQQKILEEDGRSGFAAED
jgi:hypothetical protein